jgi:diguanylate cyclase (GGDEF)-like protein
MNDPLVCTHSAPPSHPCASTQTTGALQDTNTPHDGVVLVDADLRITAADGVVRFWISRASPDAGHGGATLDSLISATNLLESARRTLDEGGPVSFLARLRGADDANAHVQVSFRQLAGAGKPLLLATIEPAPTPDAASFDALTRLPDRRELHRRVVLWRRASPEEPPQFAVLFLDLDDFKAVNDQRGHAVGDAVLRELAARWVRCVREGDLVCRYGGDEFVFLIRNVTTPRDVAPVIARLREATVAPTVVDGVEHKVQATIGAAIATSAGETLDELIAAADRDMYAHKPRVLR